MKPVAADLETLTVGAAARRLGIAAPTLRSWERRYGLHPSERSTGGHRRYNREDLARLRAMLQLVNRGVPTAAAAETVRRADFSRAEAAPAAAVSAAGRSKAAAGSVGEIPSAPTGGPSRHGPRVGSRQPADLFALANAMDAERLTHEVARSLDRSGVVEAWTTRLVPLLVEVGEQWERTGACVEVEHLASDCVAGGLRYHTRRAVERLRPDESERPVVLACLEREDHALPLLAVSAALAERAIRIRTLGAATPVSSLSAAVRRVRPAAVFIWSSTPETADVAALRSLARTRPAYALVIGGPGWQALGTPDGWVGSLAEAVETLVRAVRG